MLDERTGGSGTLEPRVPDNQKHVTPADYGLPRMPRRHHAVICRLKIARARASLSRTHTVPRALTRKRSCAAARTVRASMPGLSQARIRRNTNADRDTRHD